ncbi:MAG: MFS transporter [Clostridia bacterium]|nr:MFS transporter [Clostridia bacterium]
MRSTNLTKTGCYIGSAVLAVINNLPPLLYVIYSRLLGVDILKISLLITINFTVQILVDLAGSVFVDKIGYRASVLSACAFATAGLLLHGILPHLMEAKFLALVIATVVAGIGGGLMEVIISPMVEAIPTKKSRGYMSFLHSFYCWGLAATVILSTVYLSIAGESLWFYLPMLWATLPTVGFVIFLFAPIFSLKDEGKSCSIKSLWSKRIFWILLLLMLCAGASEVAMSQWASMFAEIGLGVDKTVGDLLGPLTFAVAMGIGRVLMGRVLDKISVESTLIISFALCLASYLITALSPIPYLAFAGCALAGLSVAALWPGTYNLATKHIKTGGTAMFALLALAGDIGCAVGPDFVGVISELVEKGQLPSFFAAGESGLKMGILLAIIFPTVAIISVLFLLVKRKKEPSDNE